MPNLIGLHFYLEPEWNNNSAAWGDPTRPSQDPIFTDGHVGTLRKIGDPGGQSLQGKWLYLEGLLQLDLDGICCRLWEWDRVLYLHQGASLCFFAGDGKVVAEGFNPIIRAEQVMVVVNDTRFKLPFGFKPGIRSQVDAGPFEMTEEGQRSISHQNTIGEQQSWPWKDSVGAAVDDIATQKDFGGDSRQRQES